MNNIERNIHALKLFSCKIDLFLVRDFVQGFKFSAKLIFYNLLLYVHVQYYTIKIYLVFFTII